MMAWLIPAAYFGGWAVCFVKVYGPILDDCYGEPDKMDRALAGALAAVTSLFWPFMIPVYMLQRIAKQGSVKERQAVIDAREHELTEREDRIAQLERELGIRR